VRVQRQHRLHALRRLALEAEVAAGIGQHGVRAQQGGLLGQGAHQHLEGLARAVQGQQHGAVPQHRVGLLGAGGLQLREHVHALGVAVLVAQRLAQQLQRQRVRGLQRQHAAGRGLGALVRAEAALGVGQVQPVQGVARLGAGGAVEGRRGGGPVAAAGQAAAVLPVAVAGARALGRGGAAHRAALQASAGSAGAGIAAPTVSGRVAFMFRLMGVPATSRSLVSANRPWRGTRCTASKPAACR